MTRDEKMCSIRVTCPHGEQIEMDFEVMNALEHEIRKSIRDGYRIFVTALLSEVELAAAEVVIRLKKELSGITLVCFQSVNGDKQSRERKKKIKKILDHADEVILWEGYGEQTNFEFCRLQIIERTSKRIIVCKNKNAEEILRAANRLAGVDLKVI